MAAACVSTLVLALALLGCGDDEEAFTVRASTTMSATSPPQTKAQFVDRVNRICRDAWIEVMDNIEGHLERRDPGETPRQRQREVIRTVLLAGIDFHIFDSIRILGSAPGEERRVEAIIGPFQEAVEMGQQRYWHAESIAEVTPHFAEYNRLARRYGLDDCLVNGAHLPVKAADSVDQGLQ